MLIHMLICFIHTYYVDMRVVALDYTAAAAVAFSYDEITTRQPGCRSARRRVGRAHAHAPASPPRRRHARQRTQQRRRG